MKIRKNTIQLKLLLYLLTFTSFVNAQIIVTGIVKDNTNEPIEFANVVLLDKKSNDIISGTISDEEGNFLIETNKKDNLTLSISYVGFTDFFKNINTSINIGTITLNSNNELDEVVITSRKKVIEKRDDKIIFNVQNSPLNKGNDGIEVLQNAPNIWVNDADEILIRQEPVIVLINGRKLNLTGSALSNYIKNLDSENIQKIEIQTNSSVNTDANATGGVVNIILKKKPLGFKTNFKSYYTHFDENLFTSYNGISLDYGSKKWNTYLLYNFTKGKGSGVFNSEFITKQNPQSQLSKGNFNSNKNTHNYKIGVISELSKNQNLGLEFYGTHNKNIFDSNNELFIAGELPIAKANNTLNEHVDKYIYNTTIHYSCKIDTLNGYLNLTADYLKHNFNNISNSNSVYEFGAFIDDTEKNTSNSNTNVYSAQADLYKLFLNKFKTDIGVKYIETKRYNSHLSETLTGSSYIPNDRTSEFDYKENILAGYISVGYDYNEKNYIKLGVRLENTGFTGLDILTADTNTHNYNSWFPSFYYSRKLANNNSLSLNYSRKLRRPSFNLLNNRINKTNDFSYDIGNPNLTPEFIDKYEVSLNNKKHSASIYFNNTTDAINGVWRIEDNIAIHQNQNYGTRKRYGFEYSVLGKFAKWWEVKGIGELFHKNFINANYNLNKTTVFVNMQNNLSINKTTSFSLSGSYMSPFLSANYTGAESYNVNLVLKKSFLDNKLNLRFYIDDIFNSQKNQNKGEFIDFNHNFYQKRDTRSFTIWLRYDFSTKSKVQDNRNNSKNNTRNRL